MTSPASTSPYVLSNHISVKDAARYSGYSVQYLRRLLRSGQLSGFKVGQLWLIGKQALESYLENPQQLTDQRFGPKWFIRELL